MPADGEVGGGGSQPQNKKQRHAKRLEQLPVQDYKYKWVFRLVNPDDPNHFVYGEGNVKRMPVAGGAGIV